MNQRMLKIINFSDCYKVTTNAFSMLLMLCWNRLTAWWIHLTVWQNRLTVWWNRLTLTNGLLTADWWWLTANWRFRPLNVKTLVYVFPCEVTNVKLSLPDRKCRRLKNNADNVTQKPKFYILRRWVLCHFTDEKLTKAWNSLGKHAKNSNSTEMANYCLQIGSVNDCLTKKTTRITSRNTWEFKHNKLNTSDWGKWWENTMAFRL